MSSGSACSSNKKLPVSPVLKQINLPKALQESAIRFSFSEFNTVAEMDYVLDRVRSAVESFRKLGSFR